VRAAGQDPAARHVAGEPLRHLVEQRAPEPAVVHAPAGRRQARRLPGAPGPREPQLAAGLAQDRFGHVDPRQQQLQDILRQRRVGCSPVLHPLAAPRTPQETLGRELLQVPRDIGFALAERRGKLGNTHRPVGTETQQTQPHRVRCGTEQAGQTRRVDLSFRVA